MVPDHSNRQMTARRLFFALALPEPLRQNIIAWRADAFPISAGRPVACANLHLTLAFLGDTSPGQEKALRQAATRLTQPCFSLQFDDCGHWPRSGVIWLGTRQAPRELLQLAGWLRAQAARQGCYQSPLPFHPHVTLLRQANEAVALPPAAPGWLAEAVSFGLYASEFDKGRPRYKLLDSWPLQRTCRQPAD